VCVKYNKTRTSTPNARIAPEYSPAKEDGGVQRICSIVCE